MRSVGPGIFVETKFRGVDLGLIRGGDEIILIDCPLHVEEGQKWLLEVNRLGSARFLALLDSSPERVLGAREMGLPIAAHDATRIAVSSWPDSFKGSSHPIGAISDYLRRLTGVQAAVPELTFSHEMVIRLGDRQVHFLHRPGPTAGSIWVMVPEVGVAFIGDTVTVAEPPYVGAAELDRWLESLDELRSSAFGSYRLISSRDGIIDRSAINAMARFLRKIPPRIEQLRMKRDPHAAAGKMAFKLLEGYEMPSSRKDRVALRLRSGLIDLYTRLYPIGT